MHGVLCAGMALWSSSSNSSHRRRCSSSSTALFRPPPAPLPSHPHCSSLGLVRTSSPQAAACRAARPPLPQLLPAQRPQPPRPARAWPAAGYWGRGRARHAQTSAACASGCRCWARMCVLVCLLTCARECTCACACLCLCLRALLMCVYAFAGLRACMSGFVCVCLVRKCAFLNPCAGALGAQALLAGVLCVMCASAYLCLLLQGEHLGQYMAMHPGKFKERVRKGIPEELRGLCWQLLSGAHVRTMIVTAGNCFQSTRAGCACDYWQLLSGAHVRAAGMWAVLVTAGNWCKVRICGVCGAPCLCAIVLLVCVCARVRVFVTVCAKEGAAQGYAGVCACGLAGTCHM